MPSSDRRLELKEKTSMAQTVWQPVVYAKGLTFSFLELLFHLLLQHQTAKRLLQGN